MAFRYYVSTFFLSGGFLFSYCRYRLFLPWSSYVRFFFFRRRVYPLRLVFIEMAIYPRCYFRRCSSYAIVAETVAYYRIAFSRGGNMSAIPRIAPTPWICVCVSGPPLFALRRVRNNDPCFRNALVRRSPYIRLPIPPKRGMRR